MKLIDVSTRAYPNTFAMVDDADFETLNQWKWSAEKRRNGFYARRTVQTKDGQKGVRMHQFLMGSNGIDVDHRDGNGLNNQRHNLRLCTDAQNMWNIGKVRQGSSTYKGVCWSEKFQRWEAHIRYNGKRLNLGCFDEEIYAAAAYNLAAIRLHGDFARLNEGIDLSQSEVDLHRAPPIKGETHPCAKLTEAQAQEVLRSPDPLKVVAKKYGVSISLVSAIRNGKVWKHLSSAGREE